jgi:hypothetical protein
MDDELNTRSTTANHSRSNTSTQDDVIDATMFKVDPDSDDNDLDDMDDIINIDDTDDNDATPIPVSELEAANAKLRHQAATLQHQELVAQVKQLRVYISSTTSTSSKLTRSRHRSCDANVQPMKSAEGN